jgi:hypothetical protein
LSKSNCIIWKEYILKHFGGVRTWRGYLTGGCWGSEFIFLFIYLRLLPQPAQHHAMVKARTLQNIQPGPTGTMAGLAWTRLQIVQIASTVSKVRYPLD